MVRFLCVFSIVPNVVLSMYWVLCQVSISAPPPIVFKLDIHEQDTRKQEIRE
jgi:hypothetical protein